MKIERFEVPGLAQYSYVVSSEGKAVVVDAIRDIDRYRSYAARHSLTITHILETHIHADFASGSVALAEVTGAELAFSAHDIDANGDAELYHYAMPHRDLADGDAIEVGSARIEAVHTPGHTPEHLSFLVFDGTRSGATPVALLSGDFLFVGSLGRPDLLGEAAKSALAHKLYRSLKERIAVLPDSVEVYPGHGAGSLCGSGMGERAETTLGYERATNPFFALDEDAFVAQILATVPAMPDYYPRMKRLNSAGAPRVNPLPGGQLLSPAEVTALAQRTDVLLLDVRRAEAFGGAHIAGAINIGAGQNLSLWAGWLLDAEKEIVLIDTNGGGDAGDLEAVRTSLIRVGLDCIKGQLGGGMAGWIDSGKPFARTTQLSVHEVAAAVGGELIPQVLILDVRSQGEWQSGHIAGAKHIMLGDLPKRMGELPTDVPIITVCGSGYRSSIAASLLERHGLQRISSMHGGMAAWMRQSLPLETD